MIGSRIVIGKDDAAGASAVRNPPEDRRNDQPNPNPDNPNDLYLRIARTCI
jgi:hypothetical protein